MDDREDHIDMAQQFLTGGFDQLLADLARHDGQFAIGLIEGDQRRVFLIQQEIRRVIEVPVALFIDTDQHRFEARTIQRIDDVFSPTATTLRALPTGPRKQSPPATCSLPDLFVNLFMARVAANSGL